MFSDCSFLYSSNNDVHASSCVYNYYQLGMENTENNMLLELLHQIIKDPCFNQLRYSDFCDLCSHANLCYSVNLRYPDPSCMF